MMYKIKKIEEVITHDVNRSHTSIVDRQEPYADELPIECEGEEELIRAIVEKIIDYTDTPLIEAEIWYADEAWIDGYDYNSILFKDDYIQQSYRIALEFHLDKEPEDAEGICESIARRLNIILCDDDAEVEFDNWNDTINVIPPSGPFHLVNKNYAEL